MFDLVRLGELVALLEVFEFSAAHYPTPYTNRNSHIAQNNGGSLINYARGGSAPKELLHNPNNTEVSSHYNN